MLKNKEKYDNSLEAYSKPLMELVSYKLDDNGVMSVVNETATSIQIHRYDRPSFSII